MEASLSITSESRAISYTVLKVLLHAFGFFGNDTYLLALTHILFESTSVYFRETFSSAILDYFLFGIFIWNSSILKLENRSFVGTNSN